MGAKGKTVMIIIEMEIIKIITTKCFYLSAVLAYFMYSFTTFCFRTEKQKKYTSSYFGVLYHSERKTKIVFNIFVQFSGLFLLFSKFTQLFNKFQIMQAGGLKQLL